MLGYVAAEVFVASLQEICRTGIRKHIRTLVYDEHPELKTPSATKKRKRPRKPKRHRRINMVPMSMGMMILGHLGDSEDSEEDSHCIQLPSLRFPGQRGRFKLDSLELTSDEESASSLHSAGEESGGDTDKSDHSTPQEMEKAQFSGSNNKQKEKKKAEKEEEMVKDAKGSGNGEKEENMEVDVTSERDVQMELEEGGEPHMDSNITEGEKKNKSQYAEEYTQARLERMSRALEMNVLQNEACGQNLSETQATSLNCLSPPRKIRCSSNTSADTSETSGIGSIGDEVSEPNDKPSPSSSLEEEVDAPPSYSTSAVCSPESATVFRSHMMRKISMLPLPEALKSYVSYYRDGSVEQ